MRGYQRKVIHIKKTGSYLFDEAYFIISREGEKTPVNEESMILEANRIIEDSIDVGNKNKSSSVFLKLTVIPFLVGALVSAALFILLYVFM